MDIAENEAKMRINALLDADSFVEIGKHILGEKTDFNPEPTENRGDGVITGYGLVNGKLVYVFSQDSSVLKGSIGKMHGRKISKLYALALKSKSPVIGLIDCGGLRISEGLDGMEELGNIFIQQTMASGIIPQILGVFGNCGGGLSLMNAMADFTFLEAGKGKLYMNPPAVVEHNKDFDFFPMNQRADGIGCESEIIGKIRELIDILPASNKEDAEILKTDDDLNRMIPDIEEYKEDGRKLVTAISDSNLFLEVKAMQNEEVVTGFIKLNGVTTGAIAVCGTELTSGGCNKAREFIAFLNAFDIPLVTLINVLEFKNTLEEEAIVGRAAGLLTKVLIHCDIPKINVIVGRGIGSTYLVLNSKHIGADVVLAWEGSKIGVISSEHAAKVFCKGEKDLSQLIEAEEKYSNQQNNTKYSAGKGYIDDIIKPQETRQRIIAAMEMLYYKEEARPKKKHIIQ